MTKAIKATAHNLIKETENPKQRGASDIPSAVLEAFKDLPLGTCFFLAPNHFFAVVSADTVLEVNYNTTTGTLVKSTAHTSPKGLSPRAHMITQRVLFGMGAVYTRRFDGVGSYWDLATGRELKDLGLA